MNEKGRCFVVAAPSGAGKTSLVKALSQAFEHIQISISHTTRPPRPGEKEGLDYYFIKKPEFQKKIDKDQMLEYATIYGEHYGTSREWVMERLMEGTDVLLEIDWQGARQIRSQFPQAVLIFILPPSMETLNERLKLRKQDHEHVIEKRLAAAKDEIAHYHEFDYIVVNDDFEHALQDLYHVVKAERLKTRVQEQKLSNLLADLLKKQ